MMLTGGNSPSLGLLQLLLATIVLASYAFAIGELMGSVGRARSVIVGLIAAAGLVGTSESWEVTFVIVGSLPLITALLALGAWTLWKLTLRTAPSGVTLGPARLPLETARSTHWVPVRWRRRMRSIRLRFQRQPR